MGETTLLADVEATVQEAIEEWATIHGGPEPDGVPLAHYIASKLVWRFGK